MMKLRLKINDCPHLIQSDSGVNSCALGFHGGSPHPIQCMRCITLGLSSKAKEDPPVEPPSLPQQAANLGSSLVKWAGSGFTATDPDTLASRMDTCKACDLWDAAGMAGTGRCRKCGCSTQAKLRMASEKCPLGKW